MNRDVLYRECAHQAGLVEADGKAEHFGGDVDRVIGGAWVLCSVYISNQEVSELLSRERTERRLEAEQTTGREIFMEEWDKTFGDAEDVRELQDTPRRGDV